METVLIYKLFLWLTLCLDAKFWLKCFVFIFPSRSVVLRDKKKLTKLTVIAVDMTHIPSSCHHLSAASRLSKLFSILCSDFLLLFFLTEFGVWFINLLIFNQLVKRDSFSALNKKKCVLVQLTCEWTCCGSYKFRPTITLINTLIFSYSRHQ